MTAQVLATELSNIIQDSKKRHPELRSTAEKSLQELKVLPSTSEAQVTADLRRRPHLVTPLLLACKVNNGKLALSAVNCIQRLILTSSFPVERLKDLLEALQECCKIGLDVQLKILQSLPQLLQLYSDSFQGELQASILQICNTLQQVKATAVSSTASAILQQIISLLFEKVESEDDRDEDNSISARLACDNQQIAVGPAAYDAYRVFEDLCVITDGQKSRFIHNAILSTTFGLELIEAVLTNHSELFDTHNELAYLIRKELLPTITRFLSERLSFSITVRTLRIFCILLREHLDAIEADCELPLSLLNHSLDADTAIPWRRALCMETYRVLYSTPNLAVDLYSLFDEESGKKNIIQECLATFVRLAPEKPALIGLGQHSSFPIGANSAKSGGNQEQAVMQADAVAGIISVEVGIAETSAPGISSQWSSIKTPCLDQLDKAEPSQIPETYAYSLVLTCLNGLSDNLAKIVLPLTIQGQARAETRLESSDSTPSTPIQESVEEFPVEYRVENRVQSPNLVPKRRSRAIPANPLMLTDHPLFPAVQSVAHLIDSCWPAILASASTFLYAALDAEFYRGLIRSVQRFTQVAGLLRLSTPRDAFLTTLAKAAVPPIAIKPDTNFGPISGTLTSRVHNSGFASMENFLTSPSLESPTSSHRMSLDTPGSTLSQRNLMCLRALVNLAIALGAILGGSWPIILENLQRADSVLAQSGTISSARDYRSGAHIGDRSVSDSGSGQSSVSSEIAAVEAAITRLFQSTGDYPNDAFLSVLSALCDLIIGPRGPIAANTGTDKPLLLRTASISNAAFVGSPQPRNAQFAIAKLGEVARINIMRLASSSVDNGWAVLTEKLLRISTSPTFESVARLMAADVLGNIIVGVTVSTMSEPPNMREEVQLRSLACLELEVLTMYENIEAERENANGTDLDVHRSSLEALRAILEQCGETLIAGWRNIFNIIETAFISSRPQAADSDTVSYEESIAERASLKPISTRIARSAFACVQLICSDFLGSLKRARVIILINIMLRFCAQKTDLNISLTTLTLFWTLSDFLQSNEAIVRCDAVEGDALSITAIDAELVRSAESGSFIAAWLLLQSRLASMTTDFRADVRNGTIQTIFRILDNSGDRLSPNVWQFCLRAVIFQIMDINIDAHQQTSSFEQGSMEDNRTLIATAETILRGVASVITTHLQTISNISDFDSIWQDFLQRCSSYLDLGSDEIMTYVFNTLSQILSAAENDETINETVLQNTWKLWEDKVPPLPNAGAGADSGNEKALAAYISVYKQLYRLISSDITDEQVLKVTKNLHQCVLASTDSSSFPDLDGATEFQSEVLLCLKSLRTDLPNVTSYIIECLAEFVILPFARPSVPARRTSTFVAFSKKTTEILRDLVNANVTDSQIYSSGAITKALGALAHSLSMKYKWQKQGKEPSMWRTTITSSVSILQTCLPAVSRLQLDSELTSPLWAEVINIATGIAEADRSSLPVNDVLLSDETLDLAALDDLRPLLSRPPHQDEAEGTESILWLGHKSMPESVRQAYVSNLCRISLMHESDTLPIGDPLDDIYGLRDGRTVNPPFTPRLRMCYSCMDELFSLVTPHTQTATETQGNSEEVDVTSESRLAETAFPFLILRCCIPLKRYIVDQPLRGLMPTPTSQRLELLYILKKCTELQCMVGRSAQGDDRMDGKRNMNGWSVPVLNQSRRHLEWLLPLVNKASGLARRDKEIADALQRVMDVAFRA